MFLLVSLESDYSLNAGSGTFWGNVLAVFLIIRWPISWLVYQRCHEPSCERHSHDVIFNSCHFRYNSFERSSHSPERPHSEPPGASYHILDLDSRHTMSGGIPPLPHHLTAMQQVPSPAHITPRSRTSPVHESMDTDSHPLNLRYGVIYLYHIFKL